MRRSFIFCVFILFMAVQANAQIGLVTEAKWSYQVSKNAVKAGEIIELIIKAEIPDKWHLYSNDFVVKDGPNAAFFTFKPHPSYTLVGNVVPVNPKKAFDEIYKVDVKYFEKVAEFRQKVKILADQPLIEGDVEAQMCNDFSGSCVQTPSDFKFPAIKVTGAPLLPAVTEPGVKPPLNVHSGSTSSFNCPCCNAVFSVNCAGHMQAVPGDTIVKPVRSLAPDSLAGTKPRKRFGQGDNRIETQSALAFLIVAFLAGLASLLTPCVFPIIPMTIAFFTKSESSRAKGLKKAFFYGFSIIAIYTIPGIILAVTVGPEFANILSTHWIPNVLFFFTFIIFGASFLGMFELSLPSSLINKMDSKSEVGGYAGIFFMAFTLVLASFSCTGPIVSRLFVEAFDGSYIRPIFGMFSFALGVALPLMLLAIFPEWLRGLPKSGGWLNSVKVILGFIEIALAFKFLSVADQIYHWGLLDREINIAIWIVITVLMGMYLLGQIRFSHDTEMKHLGVPRMGLAMLCFTLTVCLLPGMFGAPLKAFSGYLPPQSTLDFDLYSMAVDARKKDESGIGKVKYDEVFLPLPHGIKGFYDYKEALAYAKKVGKPVFIDFTGHGCQNCREMEAGVWSDPRVLKRLKEDFVVVALYADERHELPESEWYTSANDGKVKKTIGKQNSDFQITRFGSNAQPLYVITDAEENEYEIKAYDLNADHFVEFLDKGKQGYIDWHK